MPLEILEQQSKQLDCPFNTEKERKQFQTELVDFTMIQEKIANTIIATYGAESAAYRTAGVIDEAIHESDEGSYEANVSICY